MPFILTGLFAGLAIGLSEHFRRVDWLSDYLDYAAIDLDLNETAQKILNENLAPTTLVFLVIIIFTLSALYRILYGAMESEPKERKGLIFVLENFASLLGIAWFGLILGLSLPALIFEGKGLFFGLLIMSVFPLILIFQLTMITSLIYLELFHKFPEWADRNSGWRMGTRLEGCVILALAVLFVTYHAPYVELMNKIGSFLVSLL
ncbi:hypothetical protein [Marinobacter nauticus]|uniref:hypothetical protein n=1 Tax=Marinobacter nauticus TaxID=2743 RepID=UPI001D189121|nr:hypothetical protein [Marinobacter nauticus]